MIVQNALPSQRNQAGRTVGPLVAMRAVSGCARNASMSNALPVKSCGHTFQPGIDVSGRPVSMESSLRWRSTPVGRRCDLGAGGEVAGPVVLGVGGPGVGGVDVEIEEVGEAGGGEFGGQRGEGGARRRWTGRCVGMAR